MGEDRDITIRRNIQQAIHALQEALSVVEFNEDLRCALDDLEQGRLLIAEVSDNIYEIEKLRRTAKGADS